MIKFGHMVVQRLMVNLGRSELNLDRLQLNFWLTRLELMGTVALGQLSLNLDMWC